MSPEPTVKKRKIPFSVKFAIFCLLIVAALFLPTTLLFCGCMVPTVVALIVDPHPQKTAWVTVGCMNFAGTVPAWVLLWSYGQSVSNPQNISQAMSILMQATTIIMAYGGAAAGWLIFNNVTPLVSGLMVMKNEKRLKDIDKRQKELARKWGPDVSTMG